MLMPLRQVLTPHELVQARELLAHAPWGDGRVTAGVQSALAKNNEQLPQGCDAARLLQSLVLNALRRHAMFFAAALPRHIFPPLFNRYGGSTNHFGNHVDNAIRSLPGGAARLRTDLSCTLFLCDPDEYDGGELVIEDSHASPRFKLPAGDMLLYPAGTVHRVEPVTRGQRMASFFWVESMVRSAEQRRLLFDLDMHLMALRSAHGEADPATIGITGTYHNLLRMWADA